MRFFVYILFILCGLSYAFADTINDGSLIITYQTDSNGERLDKVRFWLKTPDQSLKFYPKNSEYVEDAIKKNRTIAIENLKPGNYSVSFLIPNKDLYFEETHEKYFQIKSGEITRIEQAFKKREIVFHDLDRVYEIFDWLSFLASTYSKQVALMYSERNFRPQGIFGGSLDIETNLSKARWEIYYGDKVVVKGAGSSSNIVLTPGTNYHIKAEEIEGYTVKVYPQKSFTIRSRSSFVGRIKYERSYGSIYIGAKVPDGNPIRIEIESDRSSNHYTKEIQPINGFLEWDTGPIPTGTYTVSFVGDDQWDDVSPLTVTVNQNEKANLKPDLRNNHDVHVQSNVEDAIYVLVDEKGQKFQGHGKVYVFHGIPQGAYSLEFSSNNKFLVAPEPKKIVVNNSLETVNADYKINGLLTITTNVANPFVTIVSKSSSSPTIKEELKDHSKSFSLPAGEYQVFVNSSSRAKQQKSETIHIKHQENQVLKVDFNESKENAYSTTNAQIVIISNVNDTKFKVRKKHTDSSQAISYNGKYVSFTIDAKTIYEVIFDKIDNYTAPSPILVELSPGEHRIFRVEYSPMQKMVTVPSGQMLLGDAFNEGGEDEKPLITANINEFQIGQYDVTNILFANWLTKATLEGKLVYSAESDKKGYVHDTYGRLICKTAVGDNNSEIIAFSHSVEGLQYRPIAGKENHPVIMVTWYGANMYAKDNDCRLPTEAEWEKAASMATVNLDKPLKKFRYGFSQDTIDRSWANYKWNEDPIKQFKVLTSEVGFYNGVNLLPLSISDYNQMKTHDAKSPVGAYDMSGNVFQWVSDWYGVRKASNEVVNNPKGPEMGEKKIAKGGCYDSLASELRVSKRLPLSPDHCDAYTGFRIAK